MRDDIESCGKLCCLYFGGADLCQLRIVKDAVDVWIADLICFQRLHIRSDIAEVVE